MQNKYDFYKDEPANKIWWLDNYDVIGEHIFSFDKKKTYNLFADFPDKLSKEEVEIFVKEEPYWANFFKDRLEEYYKALK